MLRTTIKCLGVMCEGSCTSTTGYKNTSGRTLSRRDSRLSLKIDQIDYCGSMRTIYVKGDRRVLLKWDGEEGLGYAEVWRNNEWRLLPTKVLESKESEFQAAIQRLCVDLHGYIN